MLLPSRLDSFNIKFCSQRERENSERDVSLLVQWSHQRQRPLRRCMKEYIFLKPSPGKKKKQQKQHVGVQSREETRCIIFTCRCRCGPEQLFNLMSVCKYCKQSRTKKKPSTTPNLFLFLEENDLKEKSLGNTPTPPPHLRNRRKNVQFYF